MGQLSDGDDDANTPLAEDGIRGLIPSWIATRAELNAVEAENVAAGILWLDDIRPTLGDQLTTEFVSQLHFKLFGDVWKWAGEYRTVDLNLGADWYMITTEVRELVDSFAYRLSDATRASTEAELDATCVDYHHRMVSVHPFLNGNGRHARLLADELCTAMGGDPFSWGQSSIISLSQTRTNYVDALRKADRGELEPLIRFARS